MLENANNKTNHVSQLSWQEIGRLAETVGLPHPRYRAVSGDSVLNKPVTIEYFQDLFRGLLTDSQTISKAELPGKSLEKILITRFEQFFPERQMIVPKLADAVISIRYISTPSNHSLTTATQDLERLTLSALSVVITDNLQEALSLGSKIDQMHREGLETEGLRELFAHEIRSAAMRGYAETLIHSGSLSDELLPALLSEIRKEPYFVLQELYNLAQLNLSKAGNQLEIFKVRVKSAGSQELEEKLKSRFEELKPQVHSLLDRAFTHLIGEELKRDFFSCPNNEIAKRLELLDYDAIRCLDYGTSSVLIEMLSAPRSRIVKQINDRVVGHMLGLTLSAWEVVVPQRNNDDVSVDYIDSILEIRRQKANRT